MNEIQNKIDLCRKWKGEIIIYGAGIMAHLLQKNLYYKYGRRIDYFCTSFERCHIDRRTGIEVLDRDGVKRHLKALYIIVLGITYPASVYEDIREYLMEAGVDSSNIITDTNDWIIYEAKPYIKDNKLNIFTLSYHVTKQCNLKCKMCGQLLFGLVPRRSFSKQQIMDDMERIFGLIDSIEILKLIGGEVMIYSKLPELIDLINDHSDQVGLLELYTNGAVEPNQLLVASLKRYRGDKQVTISDYGELSSAKETWIRLGNENDIPINVMGFATKGNTNGYKGWIDCTRVYDLNETDEELDMKYMTCGQRLDYVLEDSTLAKCTSYHMLRYALKREISKDEAVYINDSDVSDYEKKERILGLGEDVEPLSTCKYCVWGSKIRDYLPRYPAAEQMDRILDYEECFVEE